jgi:hypothetical protein
MRSCRFHSVAGRGFFVKEPGPGQKGGVKFFGPSCLAAHVRYPGNVQKSPSGNERDDCAQAFSTPGWFLR